MMPAKPAATRTVWCLICHRPCHITSLACRMCEQALVTEVEAFLAAKAGA